VMAAFVIPISSDSFEDSVGSHVPRVILFGVIPAIIPVILVVLVEVPIIPVDPLDSLPLAPELPLVSPFLCSDDSEPDNESKSAEHRLERHESLTVHDAMISRWKDRVASRLSLPSGSSSHDTLTPSSEFPLSPVVAQPGIRRRSVILVWPCEVIPFGRPYRTHPNGTCKLLTARKRVGPFSARRLTWKRVSHRSSNHHSSPDFTSDSSSFGSSSDSSSDTSLGSPSDSLSDTSSVHSLGCDASGQSYSGSSTRVASPRLVYPPVMTPRYHEAFRCWRSAPLSTPYPSTTSESSLDSSSKRSFDSSSPYVGPSRKRCRSPTNLVPLSTLVSRLIAPNLADRLPPYKRFRDSYSPEDSREEHIEIGTANAEAVADLGISDGVRVNTKDGIGMRVDIATSDIREDEEEFETAQRQLEAGQLMASRERAGLTDRIRRRSFVRFVGIVMMLEGDLRDWSRLLRGVWDSALSLVVPCDGDNGNGGNGDGGNNGNGNPNKNSRGVMPVACVCTYQDFVKCQPLNFKGTEGVVGLRRWKQCSTSTIVQRTIRVDVAFAMTWRGLMKLMTEVYCPRNEIQKMETELWNLTMKNNDLAAYTQRFQELTLLCTRMVPGEEDQIERYVRGLPDNIQGNVMSTEPTRLQDAIRLANSLMD
ncbi:putative reverse transcriptase domain-containing protein, partial [Tanacetum coccineum]